MHDTSWSPKPGSIGVDFQALAGPVGCAVLSALPALSIATHSRLDPHEMPTKATRRVGPRLISGAVNDQRGCAEAGVVDVAILPASSAARHSESDGQATASKPLAATPTVRVQACDSSPDAVVRDLTCERRVARGPYRHLGGRSLGL